MEPSPKPISPAVLNFVMTPAYERLVVPFKTIEPEDTYQPYENPFDVPHEYENVKSKGIPVLAEPKIKNKRYQKGDNASVVFEVSKAAKTAKASERSILLAKPRENLQEEPKADPFAVSKKAVSKKPLPPAKLTYYTKLAEPRARTAVT